MKKSSVLTLVGLSLGALALQGCTTSSTLSSSYAVAVPDTYAAPERSETAKSIQLGRKARDARRAPGSFDYASIYGAMNDEGISIPAFDYTKMNSKYLRQEVRYFGPEPTGTIIVDARRKQLYLVQPGGMAIRYGIAVGKEGYGWTGNSTLQWKQKWPTWTPPAEMIERKPELKKYADGLKGSTDNPLGARAMYLFKNGKDTLYRIHGTTKPFSIGKAASSGCFRMINQDVIDLYSRVGRKNKVMVRPEVQLSMIEQRELNR